MATRNSNNVLFSLPPETGKDTAAVAKLRIGGRSGRQTSGHTDRTANEIYNNVDWFQNTKQTQIVHNSQPLTLCLPCNENLPPDTPSMPLPAPPPPSPPAPPPSEILLLDITKLKTNVENNLGCMKCIKAGCFRLMHAFIEWSDRRKEHTMRSILDNPPENIVQALSSTLHSGELTSKKLWYVYVRTPGYRELMKANTYKCQVTYKRNGLAAHLYANCSLRSRKLPAGHKLILHAPTKDNNIPSNKNTAYDLNKRSILAAHLLGTSWVGLRHALAMVGVRYLSQHSFEKCEKSVGAALKDVAKQSMQIALMEEVRLSDEAGEGTYHSEELGTKPALPMSTDTGWNKRSSGRQYDSASGTTNMIGGMDEKFVILCFTSINASPATR